MITVVGRLQACSRHALSRCHAFSETLATFNAISAVVTCAAAPSRSYSTTQVVLGGRHTTTQPERVVHWKRHLSKKAKKRYKKKMERYRSREDMLQKQQAAALGLKACPTVPLPTPGELNRMSKENRRIIESIALPDATPTSTKQLLKAIDANGLLAALDAGYIEKNRQNCNYAIRVLGAHGRLEDAMRLFREMSAHGIVPSSATYTALISACAEQRNAEAAQKVFDHQRNACIGECVAALNANTPLLITHGVKDVPVQTEPAEHGLSAEIAANASGKFSSSAISEALQASKYKPNEVTYGALMHAYVRAMDLEGAFKAVELAKLDGVKLNVVNFTNLIVGCVHMGQYERAFDTFKHMRRYHCEPDVVTFTTLINACAKTDQVEKALNYLDEMKQMGLQPTTVTYNALIHAAGRSFRRYDKAFSLFAEMSAAGLAHDEKSFNAVILACSHTGDIAAARSYLRQMRKEGLTPTLVTYNCLLAVYARGMKRPHDAALKPDQKLLETHEKGLLTLEESGKEHVPQRKRAVGEYARLVEGDMDVLAEQLLADYYAEDKTISPEEERVDKLFDGEDVKEHLPALSSFSQDLSDPLLSETKQFLRAEKLENGLADAFEAENTMYPALDEDEQRLRALTDAKDDREWQVQTEDKALSMLSQELKTEEIESALDHSRRKVEKQLSKLSTQHIDSGSSIVDTKLAADPAVQRVLSGKFLFDEFVLGNSDKKPITALANTKRLSFQDFMRDLEGSVEQEIFGGDAEGAGKVSLFDSDGEVGGQSLEELLDVRNIPLPPTSDSDGEHDPIKLHDHFAKVVAERVSAALDREYGSDSEVLQQLEEELLAANPMENVIDVTGETTIRPQVIISGQEQAHLAPVLSAKAVVADAEWKDVPTPATDLPPPPGMVRRKRYASAKVTTGAAISSTTTTDAAINNSEGGVSNVTLEDVLTPPDDDVTTATGLQKVIKDVVRDVNPHVDALLKSKEEQRRVHGRVLAKLFKRAVVPFIDAAVIATTESNEKLQQREIIGRKPKLTDLIFAVQELKTRKSGTVAAPLEKLISNSDSRPAQRLTALKHISEGVLTGAEYLPAEYPEDARERRKLQLAEAESVYYRHLSNVSIQPDVITLNTMLLMYANAGQEKKAYDFLQREYARHGVKPDNRTWRSLIHMHVNAAQTNKAAAVLARMQELGATPDKDCYGLLVHGYAKDWRLKDAINTLQTMQANGLQCSEHYAFLLRQRCKEAGIVHADVPAHPVAWQFTPAVRAKRRAHSKVINKLANLALRPQMVKGWR